MTIQFNRREFLVATAALAGTTACASVAATSGPSGRFPNDFLWGAASAGHQVEGNNVNSDIWFMENVKPSVFRERSGDACNSFELWETDLDLCKDLGFSAYRFSIEWARIEPEKGFFSQAMIDHYKNIIAGCLKRNMQPVVTFNHFASPIWFAAQGGWTNPEAPELFARYCLKVSQQVAQGIAYALTFNEPNILRLLKVIGVPDFVWDLQGATLAAAAKKTDSAKFVGLNTALPQDLDLMTENLVKGHKLGRAAIQSVRPDLAVGFSIAMLDDRAVGDNSVRDQKREENYGAWLRAAKDADFVGVQNYERMDWDDKGKVKVPDDAVKNFSGSWIDPSSLANTVKYAYEVTGKPIIVSEHGIGTDDDSQRAWFIPASLKELKKVMDQGVPVKGYIHWTLLDNYEWIHGFDVHFGLHSVDLKTFKRTPKPSAAVYASIIKANGL